MIGGRQHSMPRELPKIRELYQKLRRSKPFNFPKKGDELHCTDNHGVYIIFSPSGKPLHVGRTLRGKKGLCQRLKNHLHRNSSFVRNYRSGRDTKLRKGYKFAYVKVPTARRRALLEAFTVAKQCPKYLGLGQRARR
jgi:hypothetical protein